MSRKINYYFTLVSPWAYIGDALFKSIVRKHGVAVDYRPVNLGRLFPNSGGLPLGQRHPLRQQYRLVELQRWREKRGLSFAIKPNNWPFDPSLGDRCALALVQAGFDPAGFISAAFRCVFEQERGLADRAVIADVLKACGADAEKILAAAELDREGRLRRQLRPRPRRRRIRLPVLRARRRGVLGTGSAGTPRRRAGERQEGVHAGGGVIIPPRCA